MHNSAASPHLTTLAARSAPSRSAPSRTLTDHDSLRDRYRWALLGYIRRPGELTLHHAREFSRTAATLGLGCIEMVRFHHEALIAILAPETAATHARPGGTPQVLQSAATFLTEALAELESRYRSEAQAHADALRRRSDQQELRARRISHSLLDDAAQPLVYFHLVLSEIAASLPEQAGRLAHAQEVLFETVNQLGRLSYELHPSVLDDFGLRPALESLADAVSETAAIPIFVDSSMEGRFAPSIETAIYRAVEDTLRCPELLAHATAVTISLEQTPVSIDCSISFQGVRLKTRAEATQAGITLAVAGLQDRILAAGGEVSIVPDRGQRTIMALSVPLQQIACGAA